MTSGEPPSPWSPRRPAGWSLQCLPDPGSACAARLGFALQEGGYRVLVTLGTPVLVFSALARCEKGPLGAMPCAPSPLFQPEGADEEAWGAPGDHWSRAPQSFRRPEPPVGWRLQLLRARVLSGAPQFPAAQHPRGISCFGLAMFPRAPRLRPPLVSAQLGTPAPRSRRCGAHRPLVKTTAELPEAK